MKHALRITLALLTGVIIGSLVNMGLVQLGGRLVPLPAGADVATMEGLKASINLFQPKHFLFPFLAHAIGTLAGAFLAAWLAPARRMVLTLIVGGLFFVGGVISCILIPAPKWFMAVDLVFAYFPMAWLACKLSPK